MSNTIIIIKAIKMKLKYTFIVLILLLAILTIASVSAAQDNNITQNENEALGEQISSDEIISEYNLTQDENKALGEINSTGEVLSTDFPNHFDDDYTYDDDAVEKIRIYGNEIPKGDSIHLYTQGYYKLKVQIDGKNVKIEEKDDSDYSFHYLIDTSKLKLGKHTLFVSYKDKNSNTVISKKFAIAVKNIVVKVPSKVNLDKRTYIYVKLPQNSKGKVKITIDGKTVYNNRGKDIDIYLNHLLTAPSKNYAHTVVVTYSGDGNYPAYSKKFKVQTDYHLNNENYTYTYGLSSHRYEVSIHYKLNASKVVLKIDGVKTKLEKKYGEYFFTIPKDFPIGKHNVTLTYPGDENYYKKTERTTIQIFPRILIQDVAKWDYGTTNKIYLKLPDDAKGNLTVYVDGIKYHSKKIKNGEVAINTNNIKPGSHKISAIYQGNDYTVKRVTAVKTVTLKHKINYLEANKNPIITFPNAKTLTGDIYVNFNGKNYKGKVKGSNIEVTLLKITKIGKYKFTIIYKENKTILYKNSAYFKVNPIFKVPKAVYKGKGSITILTPGEKDGTVLIWMDYNIEVSVKVVNGKAKFSLAKIKEGDYYTTITYHSKTSGKYTKSFNINILNNKIIAKDLTKYYGNSKTFNVKVTDLKGKPISGKYIEFYINDKYIKGIKTNKKGYVNLNINPLPGNYKITAICNNFKITKNLIIKPVLSLEETTVNKTSEKLVLRATLKEGKTVLSNKTVTFIFKNKNYDVKTDENGTAQLTIDKSILEKLEVGKTINYNAKYLKNTVKKSTIVIE